MSSAPGGEWTSGTTCVSKITRAGEELADSAGKLPTDVVATVVVDCWVRWQSADVFALNSFEVAA